MMLPCKECKGQCCTYPAFTEAEFMTLKLVKGPPPERFVSVMIVDQDYKLPKGSKVYLIAKPDGVCPYLVDGQCSIYNLRPKVCQDYGVVPELPCQYLYPKQAREKQMKRIKESSI